MRVFEAKRPLYQTVAEQLTAAIQAGTYPVGSMLPPEAELCQQFNVSRQTVREATRLLLQLGLVSRHQGVGTRVERQSVAEHYEQRLGSLPDIWQYVKETKRTLLKLTDVAAADAEVALPGDPKVRWRLMEGLRFLEDQARPIAWTQIYVRPAYAAVTEAKERDAVPIYSLIESRFGIKTRSVRQEISAVAIAARVATHLRVPAGSPGLSVLRQYRSTQDEVFEVSLSLHPADRYQYTMQLDLAYAGTQAPEPAPDARKG
ncbi:MAG: GntR family transcriptional regulator [Deltaproteobacteria bacterium]|nr:GntR family transcriptional regulator [Deltaproteobacteria bacterium]